MTQLQRNDAIKFLGLLTGDCKQGDNGHSWRKCPRCLAFEQIEARDPLAMKLMAAAVEALNAPSHAGSTKSVAKAKAARENGKLGGRPRREQK